MKLLARWVFIGMVVFCLVSPSVAEEGAWVLTKRETQPAGRETDSAGWNYRHEGTFGSHKVTSSFIAKGQGTFIMTSQFSWTDPPKFIAPGQKLMVKWEGKMLVCQKPVPFGVAHSIVGGVEMLDPDGKPWGNLAIWDEKKDETASLVLESGGTSAPYEKGARSGVAKFPFAPNKNFTSCRLGLGINCGGGMYYYRYGYEWNPSAKTLESQEKEKQKTTFGGSWTGSWRNSVGETGADTLELTEDASGNLRGTWSGTVSVQGRRTDATHFEIQGRTTTREYRIKGVLEGETLKLSYLARRLDTNGSYEGQSTFTKSR